MHSRNDTLQAPRRYEDLVQDGIAISPDARIAYEQFRMVAKGTPAWYAALNMLNRALSTPPTP